MIEDVIMVNLNIVPSPQYVCAKAGGNISPVKKISSYYFEGAELPFLCTALSFLENRVEKTSQEKADLVLSLSPLSDDEAWLNELRFAEQGYIMRGDGNGKVVIVAKSQIGLAYGITTLLQLPPVEGDFEIKDYPDFRYRANKWLLWAETEVWSYDFGDGVEGFYNRIIKKLDICMKYKINLVFFDAWGADTERTPYYKDLMRRCNRAARERGIHLIHGAYTMGYGLSGHPFGKHFGRVHKTDYSCLGTLVRCEDSEPYVISREFGGCLSNETLMKQKLDELIRFVREVEPGALYLHNMDSLTIHQNLWLARCESCRNKWPSDDLFAKDGMAGAFAYFFDRLNSSLKTVKNENYDASQDLIIFNVSPGYTEYHIEDIEMQDALNFWAKVREYSTVKENVYPTFREQYYNKESDTLRLHNPSFECGVIAFVGGDGFYSDDLFPTTALFHKMMRGVEVMITCSGNAFAEPLQIFNAEYMWNCNNSSFYNDNEPVGFEKFTPYFEKSRAGRYHPDEIFANGGMLDIICEKLYGEDATIMADFFRLRGTNGQCPSPYPCNKELDTNGSLAVFPFRWDTEWESEKRESYIERLLEIIDLSKKGLELLSHGKNESIKEYSQLLFMNIPVLLALYEYSMLYTEMENYFANKTVEKNKLLEKIKELSERFDKEKERKEIREMNCADVLGGAFARRTEIFENLIYDLSLMKKSLNESKRITKADSAREKGAWW